MRIEMFEFIVLEYSVTQQCFHEHTIAEMIKSNIGTIERGFAADYVPVAICRDRQEADMLFPAIQATIRGTRRLLS